MSILITKEDCERWRRVRLRDGSIDRLYHFSNDKNDEFPVMTHVGNCYKIDGALVWLIISTTTASLGDDLTLLTEEALIFFFPKPKSSLKNSSFLLKMGSMKKKEVRGSLLSGFLLILSFPNFDLEFLAWFALVPLFYSIEGKGVSRSFKLGFLTGILSVLGIIYWIIVAVHTYGNVPLILSGLILLLLVVYLSLFIGGFACLTRLIQIRSGVQTILFAPFLWVAFEYFRSFLLTGFPWANLSYSQYLNLPFIQMADITGAYGLSFVIVLVNATFFVVLRQWPKKTFPLKEVILTVITLLGFLIYGYLKMGMMDRQRIEQSPLKIGLVQGNIDQSIKWDHSFQRETLKIYKKLASKVAEKWVLSF